MPQMSWFQISDAFFFNVIKLCFVYINVLHIFINFYSTFHFFQEIYL